MRYFTTTGTVFRDKNLFQEPGPECSESLVWIRIIRILKSQDQVIHFTFVRSKIGLDYPDPDAKFLRLPNQDYQCFKWTTHPNVGC